MMKFVQRAAPPHCDYSYEIVVRFFDDSGERRWDLKEIMAADTTRIDKEERVAATVEALTELLRSSLDLSDDPRYPKQSSETDNEDGG